MLKDVLVVVIMSVRTQTRLKVETLKVETENDERLWSLLECAFIWGLYRSAVRGILLSDHVVENKTFSAFLSILNTRIQRFPAERYGLFDFSRNDIERSYDYLVSVH